ncbi:MAG TPA: fatty acid--CoA ligase [Spirochaetia bacterium]|nr:fatty acid--CoA ligase [Spirochaetia bacterium]
MSHLIARTESAYDYPLLIKNLLRAPVASNPDQEIVYRGAVRLTYRQLLDRIRRLASALVSMGIKPGDTVAVMDWDSHRYLECFFAVPMIGAVLHTINVRLSTEQLVYTINHAEDKLIIVNSEFLPILDQIHGRMDTVSKLVLIDESGTLPTSRFEGEYEYLLAAATPMAEFPDLDENTRATTFYSTGTTGMPKGVYFSHRQLVLHTLGTIASLGTAVSQGRFHREDVYMPLTPMFHVHAWGIPYVATMLGVKQVYPGKYIPETLLKLLVQEKVTFSHCVPTILNMLLSSPAAANVDLSHWKVLIGGAALPRSVAIAALTRGIDVAVGYGLSETGPVLTISQLSTEQLKLGLEEQADLRCRTGSPFAMVDVKVVDENGAEVPRDDSTAGEIVVRAPWLSQGYLKDETNSQRLWAGGWLHTQDVASRNAAGSIRITDRLKDIIKVGGEWISSLSVEDALSTHPAVAESAVIGQPDVNWGEVPLALVVLKKDQSATSGELATHVKSYADSGVLPREAFLVKVKFVDAIDKTSVGKINKVALRTKHLS